MVSNTGSRSAGERLTMPRTLEVAACCSSDWFSSREVAFSSREVAACCATASLSLRVSSAIFFLSPVWGACAVAVRRGGFLVLHRFVLGRVVRRVVTTSTQPATRWPEISTSEAPDFTRAAGLRCESMALPARLEATDQLTTGSLSGLAYRGMPAG